MPAYYLCTRCNNILSEDEINQATAEYCCTTVEGIICIDRRFFQGGQYDIWWYCPRCEREVDVSEWQPVASLAGLMKNVSLVACAVCKKKVLAAFTKKVSKLGHICPACYTDKVYHTRNTLWKGKPRKDRLSFSIEFETSRNTDECYRLLGYGYIPTRDSSIGGSEWKSPIYCNLRVFRPVCFGVLDQLRHVVGNDCGTHIHVGVVLPVKYFVQDYWKEIFGPLVLYMKLHPTETTQFWGRVFNFYAREFKGDRYCAFSAWTSCETLEFRLPRFKSAEQFYQVVKFCLKVTDMIVRTWLNVNDVFNARIEATRLGNRILRAYQREVRKLAETV